MPSPDLDAFVTAQDALRQSMGRWVTFLVPNVVVWPDGTALDPQSGQPYDPTVVPVSGEEPDEVELLVGVAYDVLPSNEADEAEANQSGVRSTRDVALDVAAVDYPQVTQATGFTLHGNGYDITEVSADGPGNLTDRYVVFGQAK